MRHDNSRNLCKLALLLGLSVGGILQSCLFQSGGTEIPNQARPGIPRRRRRGFGSGGEARARRIRPGELSLFPRPRGNKSTAWSQERTVNSGSRASPANTISWPASPGSVSFRDSVTVTREAARTWSGHPRRAWAPVAGKVLLQPQHNPKAAVVQVLGTTHFLNVGEDGRFILAGLAARGPTASWLRFTFPVMPLPTARWWCTPVSPTASPNR